MGIAPRMADIAPFHVMELMARAAELERGGRSVIHLEVGEPDFPAAQPILDAAQEFLRAGHVHYTAALGLPELREAISRHYLDRYGLVVPASRIVVTAGASGALMLALGTLVAPGDEWLQPDPGYPCNRHFVRLLEGRPVALPVDSSTGFQPTAVQVAAAWGTRTRGLMLASPANPTGTLIELAELVAIAATVVSRDGHLVVDEIYHGLTYGRNAVTALSLDRELFVINSFSKYFGMTGWRLGWLVAPQRHIRQIEKLAQNLYIAPSTIAQHAALAAFRPETLNILEARRAEFQARRDLLLPGLERLGLRVAARPEGAFYAYADCSALAEDSETLAYRILDQAGVALTPGLDFGSHSARSHLRIAYTTGQDAISEALARLEKVLG